MKQEKNKCMFDFSYIHEFDLMEAGMNVKDG